MSLVDDFLESVTDECGNKIDFSNIEVEGFSGVVAFGTSWADIYVDLENSYVNDFQGLTRGHLNMLDAFGKYVQQKMKESREYFGNNKIK